MSLMNSTCFAVPAVGLGVIAAFACGSMEHRDAGGGQGSGKGTGGGAVDAGQGGGIGTSEAAIYQSGTRIRARVGTTPDGAKTFLGWYDTVEQEPCFFLTASDGALRCLPGMFGGGSGFSDANCTAPAYLMPLGCAPKWVLTPTQASCAVEYHWSVSPIGGVLDAGFYGSSAPGTCSSPAPAPSGYQWRALGAAAPPTQFVQATESIE